MSDYQEFTGKSVEEALRNARDAFGVGGLDDLDFEILTPGSRGVLGMGAEPARIIAAPRSALGGEAPRRAAAEATPLPPSPPRPPRERDDRGRGRGRDRDRGRDRGGFREEGRTPRPGGGAEDAVGSARPEGGREGRESFRGTRRDAGRGGRGEERRERGERPLAAEAPSPEDESAARAAASAPRGALSSEREEIQAAQATPEALAAGREILDTLIRQMGYQDVTVEIVSGETSKLDVRGGASEREALGALIGRKGERLSALQHLVNLMLSRRMGDWTRVLVDVEDYRGRRERQLRDIADRAAQRVAETGKMLQLEPMPALERRWIHLALRGHAAVVTQSIGEEPNRRVVILPRP